MKKEPKFSAPEESETPRAEDFRHGDERLTAFLERLEEEVWQFGCYGVTCTRLQVAGLREAMIERFAVHFRNVAAFIWGAAPLATDFRAFDYFSDPSRWDAIRPAMSELVWKQVEVAYEIVMKPREERSARQTPSDWPVMALLDELLPCMELFANEADRVPVARLRNVLLSLAKLREATA